MTAMNAADQNAEELLATRLSSTTGAPGGYRPGDHRGSAGERPARSKKEKEG